MPELEQAPIPPAMAKGYREQELLRLEHNRRGAEAVAEAKSALGLSDVEWDAEWAVPADKRKHDVEGSLSEFRSWQKSEFRVAQLRVTETVAPLREAWADAEIARLKVEPQDFDMSATKRELKESTEFDSEIDLSAVTG